MANLNSKIIARFKSKMTTERGEITTAELPEVGLKIAPQGLVDVSIETLVALSAVVGPLDGSRCGLLIGT